MYLTRVLLDGNLLLKARKHLDRQFTYAMRNIILRFRKVQNNKIFISTYDNNYTCNPSYIADEIVRRNLDVDIVWVGPKKGIIKSFAKMPHSIRVVKRDTVEMYEEQASARIWIDNALNCVWYGIPKKRNQVYINTWHGSMGIKRLSGNRFWLKRAKKCKSYTDYCITNSKFEEDVFTETFWPGVEYLKYGHARNDILFKTEEFARITKKVKNELKIPQNRKVLLYAPTFRDNGDIHFFNIDYRRLKESLEKRFGGEWTIAIRMHFKNGFVSSRIKESEWLVNATAYEDMQELMVACDAGITDYSSWAYDFILTKKPLFLYVPDVANYDQARGFYFNIESTPFLNAHNNDELNEGVMAFDDGIYQQKIEEFLNDKGCYESGTAAKQTVDFIEKILSEGIEE